MITRLVGMLVIGCVAVLGSAQGVCVDWTLLSSTGPAPTYHHSLAFDSWRDRVVMFGGSRGCATSETWEFDGTTWAQRFPTTTPPARYGAAMTFDEARGVVVMWGGRVGCGSGEGISDTWLWDGDNWIEQFPTQVPPLAVGTFEYDPVEQRSVLFLGWPSPSGGPVNEIWAWDGADWEHLTDLELPDGRFPGAVAFDVARQQFVMFGGFSESGETFLDTLALDGTNWEQLSVESPYLEDSGSNIWYNEQVGILLRHDTGMFAQEARTYAFISNAWIQVQGDQAPKRDGGTAVYDTIGQRLVRFGGHDTNGLQGDTWAAVASAGIQVLDHPDDIEVDSGGVAQFSVTALGDNLSFLWLRDGIPLDDTDRISGATTDALTITGVRLDDVGTYAAAITDACMTLESEGAILGVRCGPADFDDNGVVDTRDVLVYLIAWAGNDPSADLNGDGVVNTLDFLHFLNLWNTGC